MKSELGCSIDSDFEPDWEYLVSRLDTTQVAKIRRQAEIANTLVLIDHKALGDEPSEFGSTGGLTYHGRHKAPSK